MLTYMDVFIPVLFLTINASSTLSIYLLFVTYTHTGQVQQLVQHLLFFSNAKAFTGFMAGYSALRAFVDPDRMERYYTCTEPAK
jgi:hypothetical protein